MSAFQNFPLPISAYIIIAMIVAGDNTSGGGDCWVPRNDGR